MAGVLVLDPVCLGGLMTAGCFVEIVPKASQPGEKPAVATQMFIDRYREFESITFNLEEVPSADISAYVWSTIQK